MQNQKPQLVTKTKTKINIDCIKVNPNNSNLWALSFYQQHPEFVGGIQIISTKEITSPLGEGEKYVEMGPIMHVEWLKMPGKFSTCETEKYWMLAVSRCDRALVISYSSSTQKVVLESEIFLSSNIFCLYCDWKLLPQENLDILSCMCIASTNESQVFTFVTDIPQNEKCQIKTTHLKTYSNHEYAVWACKLNPKENKMIVGDEVNCLYYYNLDTEELIAKNKKAHTEGICEIFWIDDNNVLTGSFDGSLVWIVCSEFANTHRKFNIGGIIWRIIPMSKQGCDQYLLCNSSEKKFQVFNLGKGEKEWDSGEEHDSLTYSADWNGEVILASSFYDQVVTEWKYAASL